MKERLVVSRHQPVATNALGEVYYQPLSERAQGALMDLGELGQKQDRVLDLDQVLVGTRKKRE